MLCLCDYRASIKLIKPNFLPGLGVIYSIFNVIIMILTQNYKIILNNNNIGFFKIFSEDIFVIINRRKDFIFSLIGTNTKTTFNDAHFIYENSARAWF